MEPGSAQKDRLLQIQDTLRIMKPFEDRIDETVGSVSGKRFQMMAFLAVAGGINAFNLIFYNMAYMELVPHFKCRYLNSDTPD